MRLPVFLKPSNFPHLLVQNIYLCLRLVLFANYTLRLHPKQQLFIFPSLYSVLLIFWLEILLKQPPTFHRSMHTVEKVILHSISFHSKKIIP